MANWGRVRGDQPAGQRLNWTPIAYLQLDKHDRESLELAGFLYLFGLSDRVAKKRYNYKYTE
jgi:hypothetical protein